MLQGCELALKVMKQYFPDMEILSLSGNFCTDKKSSAVNWFVSQALSTSVSHDNNKPKVISKKGNLLIGSTPW